MDSETRSRASRARAAEALIRFGLLAGEHATDFVVIGGLNPDFLAPEAPVEHQGTTDIDLLFALGFNQVAAHGGSDFSWLDTALSSGGFNSANGWRWDATLGGALVRLEFLCDVGDSTTDTVALPGSQSAVASKLAGPAAALFDPVDRVLEVPDDVRADFSDAPDSLALRFANLGGYLLAKAAAARSRMLEKDKYDIMYVLLHNDGGAGEAAAAVARQLARAGDDADVTDIRWVMERFEDPTGQWPGAYALTMIDTGDDSTEAQLRADAAAGASRFLAALDPPVGPVS